FAEAIKALGTLEDRQKNGEVLRRLSEQLIDVVKKLKNVELNGPEKLDRSPDNINFTLIGMDQDTVIAKLDLAGFAVSTGSACVSGSSEPSHVIRSLGKIKEGDAATIRVSLGKHNKTAEIEAFIAAIRKIIK
ncbi:MAG: aminotransferase class V-fold PLP-dependent enzyme, partial [Candidatus Doudnabacteria bacterium]|nr:aminotransferase class V-fold PLP-dependent enzyme [Candidatus Doudnabacteria bacterium]